MNKNKIKVLILDMQPIDPPIGGGRIRLIGLYHNLGNNVEATYIGSYDWPGEKYRDHKLSNSLREINIPLSKEHFEEIDRITKMLNGKNIIDLTFHQLVHMSPEYLSKADEFLSDADVIIFSHPWVYPAVKEKINNIKQLIIYDSQNVEGYLRYSIFNDDKGYIKDIVKEVIKIECELCSNADIILACSHEDKELFNRLYGTNLNKIKIVPNGVFTDKIKPITALEKNKLKKVLKLKKNTAIFIGSNYAPNSEAAKFIIENIADNFPDISFIIAGGIGESLININKPENVLITGIINDDEKISYLNASDIALNPMFSGSGTNIKMFDFMAAGIPIISTDKGRRGIIELSYDAFIISDINHMNESIKKLFSDKKLYERISINCRKLAEEFYSWKNISSQLGFIINQAVTYKAKNHPYFSVIIPTYERHKNLEILLTKLKDQTFKNFEVIIIDQSKDEFDFKKYDLNILYYYTNIKGAVKARNTGGFFAFGDVIAFIDDDCIPDEAWLKNAKNYFDKDKNIIGIEGLIKSDIKYSNEEYRVVTNINFKSTGFMTANLFIKREIFNKLNGFDLRFDNPHFREDTDFGWRALEYGNIPFADDVVVLHPAQKRKKNRESLTLRSKFFIKDALLLKKHPERYEKLFFEEEQWKYNEYFWEYFFEGIKIYNINIDDYKFVKDLFMLKKGYFFQ